MLLLRMSFMQLEFDSTCITFDFGFNRTYRSQSIDKYNIYQSVYKIKYNDISDHLKSIQKSLNSSGLLKYFIFLPN